MTAIVAPVSPAPEFGQLARVRGRMWVVADVARDEQASLDGRPVQHLVSLVSVEDDATGEELEVVWEIEPGTTVIERAELPAIAVDRLDDPPELDQRQREPYVFLPAEVEGLREGLQPLAATLVSVLAYSGPRPEEALRLTWTDVGSELIHYDGRKTRRPRWTPLLPQLASDLREWRLASGRLGDGPVFPAHDGGHWQPDDWRNWRHRTWQRIAPRGTRPRDLRGSYVTLRVYEGMLLTEIARHVGTSVAMLDRHYAGVIANWDGERVPADEQIRRARDGAADMPDRAEGRA